MYTYLHAFYTFMLSALFTVSGFAAQKNPQIRTCRHLAGIYFEAKSETDLFGFCAFGESVIGTLDLVRYYGHLAEVASVRTYLNNVTTCEPFGKAVTLSTVEGKATLFCAFSDNSMIDYKTLSTGLYDQRNSKLNLALDIAFGVRE